MRRRLHSLGWRLCLALFYAVLLGSVLHASELATLVGSVCATALTVRLRREVLALVAERWKRIAPAQARPAD